MSRITQRQIQFMAAITVVALLGPSTVAEQLFRDDFSSADGPLVGANPGIGGAWTQTGGNSSNPIQISGGVVKLGTTGQDANAAFVSPIPIGSSYQSKTSFDLTLASVKPDEDYFLHLSNPAGSTTNFYQRLLIRWAPAGFEVGLLDTAGTANGPIWSGQQLSFGTSYHFDVAWDTQPGFTSTFSVEVDGAPLLQHVWYGNIRKPTEVSAINLRQGIASPVPSMQQDLTIDNVVVTATQRELAPHNIFQWEYVDPADPSLGKRTSSRLTGDGIGLRAQAGLEATSRNLARAFLAAADLQCAWFNYSNLTNADLSGANLSESQFYSTTLTGADFAGADISRANFERSADNARDVGGTGIAPAQLYATASYAAHDLKGINFAGNNLVGADFSHQNLAGANFRVARLTGANFAGADVRGVHFDRTDSFSGISDGTGITPLQLYSTASYQNHDLTGISLTSNDFGGANFSGQNLSNARLAGTNLSGADFSSAEIRGASFQIIGAFVDEGMDSSQLASTASYQAHDLSGVDFRGNNLSGANLAGQNLTNVGFEFAQLIGASFRQAVVTNTRFDHADLTNTDFSQTDLTGVQLIGVKLAGANFDDAEVRGARIINSAFTVGQLASTASYQAGDLSGIALHNNDLSNVNLSGQNLSHSELSGKFSRANFSMANLTEANLIGADLTGANLSGAILTDAIVAHANLATKSLTLAQLYSTASYKVKELAGVGLLGSDLSGVEFAGQDLTGANLYATKLVGANLASADLTSSVLTEADLTQANLTNANLTNATLVNVNFREASLAGANLAGANLLGANLSGADVRDTRVGGRRLYRVGCSRPSWGGCIAYGRLFPDGIAGGISVAQLSATASYAERDLSGIDLSLADLTGANFAGFDLSNANFTGAKLTGVDFSGAVLLGLDTRDAAGLSSISAPNFIRPDGQVDGLELSAGQVFVVRDFDRLAAAPIPIKVEQHFIIESDGELQFQLDADPWDSTISFVAGVPVALGGNLDLEFAEGTNLLAQIGRTFQLFDWTGVNPSGTFSVGSPYVWDLSKLYSTGEITFLAPSGLPGDFNGDAIVDAADFTYWRDQSPGKFTSAAFEVWKRHFGFAAGAGGAMSVDWDDVQPPAVPEPHSILLIGVAIGAVLAWRRIRLGGLRLAVLALFLIPCSRSPGEAPHVLLTKVGDPIWRPVDFQLFSAPAAPFPDAFYHVIDQLLPLEGPSAVGYTPHAGPYDTELTTNALAAGFVNKSVFTPAEIDLQPNAVYLAFMIVPDPGVTGSSRDFASGPVIPDATFPLTSNVDVWRDGVLVDFLTGSDYLVPVQGRDEPFDGTSHMDAIQSIWHPWDDDLSAPIFGNYELRWSMRDAQGAGWNMVAPFRVTPPGDFNGDGSVDSTDFTLWRDTLGSSSLLAADGNGNGLIDAGDYDVWKSNFGQTLGGSGAANVAVPEPSAALLLSLAVIGGGLARTRQGRSRF